MGLFSSIGIGPSSTLVRSLRDSNRNESRGGNILDQYAGTPINTFFDPANIFGGRERGQMLDDANAQRAAMANLQLGPTSLQAAPNGRQTLDTMNLGTPGPTRQYTPNPFQQQAKPARMGTNPMDKDLKNQMAMARVLRGGTR